MKSLIVVMSVACGTLSASFGLPIDYASSGGQMNDFPSKKPSGQVPEELWNVDSNITIWKQHMIRKTAANLAHSVHRHDQIRRLKLPGSEYHFVGNSVKLLLLGGRATVACLVQIRAFSRPGVTPWDCGIARADHARCSGQLTCTEVLEVYKSLYPSGHKERPVHRPYDQFGKPFASTLRRGWDNWQHVTKREGAKMSQGVHSHSARGLKSTSYPQTNCELNPAAIYTLKYRKFGEEEAMHKYLGKTALPRLGRRDNRTLRALKSLSEGRVSKDEERELAIHRTPPQSSTAPLSEKAFTGICKKDDISFINKSKRVVVVAGPCGLSTRPLVSYYDLFDEN